VKFEGKTQAKYDELKQYLNMTLHSYPEIDWVKDTVNAETLK